MKRALVTGGANGIGSAVVQRLLDDDWSVLVLDIEPSHDSTHPHVEYRTVDLSDAAAIRATCGDLGDFDGAVLAAGVTESPSADSGERWQRVMSVNAEANFILLDIIGRRMNPGGAIVVISSIEATYPVAMSGPTTPAYCASKAAVEALVRAFACDLGPRGVRVNAVAPGLTHTRMSAGLDDVQRDWINDHVPLERIAAPEEIAAPAVFLLGAGASYVTGCTLTVDGGLTTGLVRRTER